MFTAGLSYGTDESSLKETFSQYGEVIEGTWVTVYAFHLKGMNHCVDAALANIKSVVITNRNKLALPIIMA